MVVLLFVGWVGLTREGQVELLGVGLVVLLLVGRVGLLGIGQLRYHEEDGLDTISMTDQIQ